MLTASTTVVDEPTTFYFDNQAYTSRATSSKKFYGTVTLRDALAHSLNVATVKVGADGGLRCRGGYGQPRRA